MRRLAEVVNNEWNPESKFWRIIKHNLLGLMITWLYPLILSLILSISFLLGYTLIDDKILAQKSYFIGIGFTIYPVMVAIIFIGYISVVKPIIWIISKLFN